MTERINKEIVFAIDNEDGKFAGFIKATNTTAAKYKLKKFPGYKIIGAISERENLQNRKFRYCANCKHHKNHHLKFKKCHFYNCTCEKFTTE